MLNRHFGRWLSRNGPLPTQTARFPLRRYFALHGAIVTMIVAVATIYAYRLHQEADVLQAAERENISLARSFANALSMQGANGFEDLDDIRQTDKIDFQLATLTRGLPVHKVKIFEPGGTAIYSSDRSQIGTSSSLNPGFQRAIATREAVSKTSFRGQFSAFSGILANVHLAETYVPIVSADGSVLAVFELYSDISRQIVGIDADAGFSAVVASILFALHFLASLALVGRADRLIKEQHRGLVAAHAEVKAARAHLAAALKHMAHGITMFDSNGRLLIYNDRLLRQYGLSDHHLVVGMSRQAVVQLIVGEGFDLAAAYEPDGNPAGPQIEYSNGRKIISVVQNRLPNGDTVCTHEDVTEQRRSAAEIERLALSDALTELANRRRAELVLRETMAEDDPARRRLGLLLIDLDGFKSVNDVHGHLVGDQLLRSVARVLQTECVDRGLACRLGGDEFAVLLPGCGDSAELTGLADRIIAAVAQIATVAGQRGIGASIGATLLDETTRSLEDLLRSADAALYRAKRSGKGRCFVHEAAAPLLTQDPAAQCLERALGRDERQTSNRPAPHADSGSVRAA